MPKCHSTNDIAYNLIENNQAKEGTVVLTDQQTSGRGQRGNKWEAEPGANLTFSLILAPKFLPIPKQFFLNIITSLGINDMLVDYLGNDLRVKWPNDIYWNDQKLGGILIQNIIKGNQLFYTVIGIGINVNQLTFNQAPSAVSLKAISGKEYNLKALFSKLLTSIEKRYLQLMASKFESLKNDYLNRLYWYKEWHTFKSDGVLFEGKIIGIDTQGKLLILRSDKKQKSYDLKEIVYLS